MNKSLLSKRELWRGVLLLMAIACSQFLFSLTTVTGKLICIVVALSICAFLAGFFLLSKGCLDPLERWVDENRNTLLSIFLAAFLVCLIILQWYLYYFDDIGDGNINCAYYGNTFWNTTHGRPFFCSITNANYFSLHVSLAFLLFVPFYWVLPNMFFMIVLQDIVIVLTAYLIFRYFKERVTALQLICLIGVLLLYTPFIGWAIKEFEPSVLACPIIVLIYNAYVKNKLKQFLVYGLLLCLIKENMIVIPFSFGLHALVMKRSYAWWSLPILFTCVYALLVLYVITPAFSQDSKNFYGGLYLSQQKVSLDYLLLLLASGDTWRYIVKMFAPILYILPFFYRNWLLFLPAMGINLFFKGSMFEIVENHYNFQIALLLILIVIWNLPQIRIVKNKNIVVFGMLFVAIIGFRFAWPGARIYSLPANASVRNEVIKLIPKDASCMVHGRIFARLSNRRNFKVWQINFREKLNTDYFVLNTAYVPTYIGQQWELPKKRLQKTLWLIQSKQLPYELIYSEQGIKVFKLIKNS